MKVGIRPSRAGDADASWIVSRPFEARAAEWDFYAAGRQSTRDGAEKDAPRSGAKEARYAREL